MQFKFFNIPVNDIENAGEELNKFLRSHRVLEVWHELANNNNGVVWHFSVKYLDSPKSLQHAVMNVCHPVFESFQISDSYACRLNKGTFAAKEKAECFQKEHRWFLKLDVRKYFDSIGHDILFKLLNRRFKDQKVLQLFYQIIQSYDSQRGYGVPIGNLTSQYFANHYLALADHFAKETLHLKGYVRYMDDMVMWSNSREELLEAGTRFTDFIHQDLQLQLKPPIINKVEHGLTFLGFRIFPDKNLLSQRSKKRFEQKLKAKIREVDEGKISQTEFSQSVMALYGFIGHSHSRGYALKTLEKTEHTPRAPTA